MDINSIAKQLGKRGGNKTKNKYGKDHYKKIGIMGAKKRWKINVKVEIEGKLFNVLKIDFANGNTNFQTITFLDEGGNVKEIVGDYPVKPIKEKI